MIKSNKANKAVRLPKISMPIVIEEAYLISRPKDLMNRSSLKQNCNPKCSIEVGTQMEPLKSMAACKEQKNKENKVFLEQSMFATRVSCFSLKRDMRARMKKYSQERTMFLTERGTRNSCSIAERLIENTLNSERNNKEQKIIECPFPIKASKMEEGTLKKVKHIKHMDNESMTRWNNNNNEQLQQEEQHNVLEEFVALCLSKKQ